MALVLTPDVFLDLMRMCLTWQWERALDRQKASHNRENPLYPTQIGWTTVDKIVRILCGLTIVTTKETSVLYNDRRLQYLALRNAEIVASGDQDLLRILESSNRDFVLQCAAAESINREKMLRNMRFYITRAGRTKAEALFIKYAGTITNARYFAEIENQDSNMPESSAGKASVMSNYRKKVAEETEDQ